jgi:hypothetical protein
LNIEKGTRCGSEKLYPFFGGTAFETAPFDLIDAKGRFIEVKINASKKNKYRIQLSKDEVNFGKLAKLFILFINTPSGAVEMNECMHAREAPINDSQHQRGDYKV